LPPSSWLCREWQRCLKWERHGLALDNHFQLDTTAALPCNRTKVKGFSGPEAPSARYAQKPLIFLVYLQGRLATHPQGKRWKVAPKCAMLDLRGLDSPRNIRLSLNTNRPLWSILQALVHSNSRTFCTSIPLYILFCCAVRGIRGKLSPVFAAVCPRTPLGAIPWPKKRVGSSPGRLMGRARPVAVLAAFFTRQ
jgi:hypothetical protein